MGGIKGGYFVKQEKSRGKSFKLFNLRNFYLFIKVKQLGIFNFFIFMRWGVFFFWNIYVFGLYYVNTSWYFAKIRKFFLILLCRVSDQEPVGSGVLPGSGFQTSLEKIMYPDPVCHEKLDPKPYFVWEAKLTEKIGYGGAPYLN